MDSLAYSSPADQIRGSGFDLPTAEEVAEKADTIRRRGGWAEAYCYGALEAAVALAVESWERGDDERVGLVLRSAVTTVLAREAASRPASAASSPDSPDTSPESADSWPGPEDHEERSCPPSTAAGSSSSAVSPPPDCSPERSLTVQTVQNGRER